MIQNPKFAFFGTGEFAVSVAEALVERGFTPAVVITTKDKPKGRSLSLSPSPMKIWAKKLEIKWEEDYGGLDDSFDFFAVADFGRIIPKNILDLPKKGCVNVHPSLLPKFRGPSPIQSFLLSGEERTGVTIMLLDEEMDHGPILTQEEYGPKNNETAEDLYKKLSSLGGDMLARAIPFILEGKVEPKEQDHSSATYTKKIKKEDGLVFTSDRPEDIWKKFKALYPWPGTYFILKKDGKDFTVKITGLDFQNRVLKISKIIPEGKKEMGLADFLRGHQDFRADLEKFL